MPQKITLPEVAWASLIIVGQRDGVFIEGNILKLLDPEDSKSYQDYLDSALAADKAKREKRLQVTKQVQDQNKELLEAQRLIQSKTEKLESSLHEIQQAKQATEDALSEAHKAREDAEASQQEAEQARKEAESAWQDAKKDLDYMQRRTQFELMGSIVRVALFVIIGVGGITTSLYAIALFGYSATEADTTLLANTWSNMFGILLTNSFSIIGTIMGVKYASEGRSGNDG